MWASGSRVVKCCDHPGQVGVGLRTGQLVGIVWGRSPGAEQTMHGGEGSDLSGLHGGVFRAVEQVRPRPAEFLEHTAECLFS